MTNRKLWLVSVLVIMICWIKIYSTIGIAYRNVGLVQLVKQRFTVVNSLLLSYNESAEVQKVIDYFRVGRKVFFRDQRMLRSLALSLWFNGDIQAASSEMMVYSQKNPQDRTAQLFLGDMAYSMGDFDSAIVYWSVLPIGQILVGRAEDAINRGNQAEAEVFLAIATKVGPHLYGLHYRIAEQYARLVRIYTDQNEEKKQAACARAAEAYERALRFEPALGFVYIHYGALLRSCGRIDAALKEFSKVDESFSLRTRAWANHEVGLTYWLTQDSDLAVPFLERAVEMDPARGTYRISLARVYAALNRKDEARIQLEVALQDPSAEIRAAAVQLLKILNP